MAVLIGETRARKEVPERKDLAARGEAIAGLFFQFSQTRRAHGIGFLVVIDLPRWEFPDGSANGYSFLANEDELSFRGLRYDYNGTLAVSHRPGERLRTGRRCDRHAVHLEIRICKMDFVSLDAPAFLAMDEMMEAHWLVGQCL